MGISGLDQRLEILVRDGSASIVDARIGFDAGRRTHPSWNTRLLFILSSCVRSSSLLATQIFRGIYVALGALPSITRLLHDSASWKKINHFTTFFNTPFATLAQEVRSIVHDLHFASSCRKKFAKMKTRQESTLKPLSLRVESLENRELLSG